MMRWTTSLIAAAPLLSLGACHAVILNAQGLKGSPASVGFQVDPAVARNCITINPCQQDTTIIRDAEIQANVVNQCGRTELKGNIDVGENTENALSAGAVTQVEAGGEVTVTIHQVNADGAGPFFCDIDQTSNSGVGIQNLTVVDNVPGTNGLSQAKAQAFDVKVKMPDDLKCTGGSTGNVCTVRCRNNAIAGPFGGCFPVQQADTRATKNSPNTIDTKQTLKAVLDQVQINQADFGKAVDANKEAGSNEAKQNLAAVNALLGESVTTRKFPQETPSVALGGNQPQITGGAGGNKNGGDNGNKNGGDNGNKNGGDNGNKNGGDAGNKNGGDAGNKKGGNSGNGGTDDKPGGNGGVGGTDGKPGSNRGEGGKPGGNGGEGGKPGGNGGEGGNPGSNGGDGGNPGANGGKGGKGGEGGNPGKANGGNRNDNDGAPGAGNDAGRGGRGGRRGAKRRRYQH